MRSKSPRVAVRAIILHQERLLLVNAWPDGRSNLMCAPGGGVEAGASLTDNLAREVYEETGLKIEVGAPCLVNEFHAPKTGFHQVEVFFRCKIIGTSEVDPNWQDPENIVAKRIWATKDEMAGLMVKPDALASVAFAPQAAISYDPLEVIVS